MEDKTIENIPQVGSGQTGESHPSLKEGCPTDSGGDNHPFTEKTEKMVGDQAISTEGGTERGRGPTEDEEIVDPFKRRESVSRTPPKQRQLSNVKGRHRSGSCPDIDRTCIESSITKRKREEGSMDTPVLEELQDFQDLIKKINEDAGALQDEIKNSYKPKKEFKNLISSIVLWAKELDRKAQTGLGKGLKEWLEEAGEKTGDQGSQQLLRIENQNLRRQIQYLESRHQMVPQNQNNDLSHLKCQQCKQVQRIEARKQILSQDKSFDGFQQVTEEDWKDKVFPRIQVKQGNILEAPNEYTLMFPCNKDFITNHKEVKKAIENFGGQEGLKKQNKKKGEMAAMVHSLGYPEDGGTYIHTSREIYYPILSDGGINEKVEDGNIFQALKTLKAQMLKNSKNKLAMPEIEGVTGIVITRMMEFLFDNTNVEVVMYKPNDGQKSGGGSARPIKGGGNTMTGGANSTAKKTKPKPEALLIKMGGKTYSDLLKTMKQTVNPSQIGVDIREIRKTRNGDLLLTIQNGANKAEVLKKEISKKMPGATTSLLINKKILHIKDLDEVVTEEEIREAISKSISVKPESFEIRALRPAYASKQNCTVIMMDIDAEKLIQLNKIKIGWTNCRIMERKQETKCFRCWKYGHIKEQCSGPDRGNMCLKCGQAGHKVSDCKNKAYCVFCNEEGHQSGNPKCPKNGNRHSQAIKYQ